jgi:hypothetical protein
MYLRALAHHITGFGNITTREITTHFYTNYGWHNPANLQANNVCMKERYDPNQPSIKTLSMQITLITQVKDAIKIADAATASYKPEQLSTLLKIWYSALAFSPSPATNGIVIPSPTKHGSSPSRLLRLSNDCQSNWLSFSQCSNRA